MSTPNSLTVSSSSSSSWCSNPIITRRPLPSLFSVRIRNPPNPTTTTTTTTLLSSSSSSSSQRLRLTNNNNLHSKLRLSNLDSLDPVSDNGNGNGGIEIEIEIEKIGNNSRRIRSKIVIDATLQTVWNLLTDYERLSDFLPGLALSQLLEKRPNFARLFQIGEQNLAFGLKFNAKGIVDCYERDLEILPFCQRRDIEFKMIEGDFQLFEGKWSIEQCQVGKTEDSDSLIPEQFNTTLSYVVDVEPKLWLPVRLVEGRLCKEIKKNLSCIREEAQKVIRCTLPA